MTQLQWERRGAYFSNNSTWNIHSGAIIVRNDAAQSTGHSTAVRGSPRCPQEKNKSITSASSSASGSTFAFLDELDGACLLRALPFELRAWSDTMELSEITLLFKSDISMPSLSVRRNLNTLETSKSPKINFHCFLPLCFLPLSPGAP